MRKNVCFWYIFGCWIHICFQNFSITHTFHAASDYVKTQAYICESLGACSRYSGHVVSDVIHMWLTVLCQLLARAQCVVVSEVHSVCFTINMPGKCVNSMDAFCYICRGEGWHSNPEDGLSQPWLRNAMSIISAAKWVIRTRVGLPIFVVWHVPGFSRHGQKVHAVCLSSFLWFGESPQTMFQIATSAWPVSLV